MPWPPLVHGDVQDRLVDLRASVGGSPAVNWAAVTTDAEWHTAVNAEVASLRTALSRTAGTWPPAAHSGVTAEIDTLSSMLTATVSPTSYANATDIAIGGRTYRVQSPGQAYSFAADVDPSPTYTRHELRDGERWINDINNFPGDNRQRCEINDQANLSPGVDYQRAWSVRITTDSWRDSTSAYNIFTQFHQDNMGSPIVNFTIIQGTFSINTRGSTTTTGVASVQRHAEPWTYNGQWVHFVAQARFSTSAANGYLKVWRNGTQVVDLTGIALGYNSANLFTQKAGMYRSGHTATVVVEIANLEFGTADLSARITSPLPVPA